MINKILISPPKRLRIILVVAVFSILFTSFSKAQTKLNALIFTGGHKFEREAFFDMFDNMTNIEYKEVIHPHANPLFESDSIDDYDVLIFYDMVQKISDSQKIAFIDILKRGKPVLFLHHSLVSYQDWGEFEKIIGGRFVRSKTDKENSTYRHDVKIPVRIVNKKHPITKRVKDFIIHDEVYGNFNMSPTISPLLTTTHPESGKTIGWTNNYGKSQIVYIQLGHDHNAYDNPIYRRIIKQSIDWVVSNK